MTTATALKYEIDSLTPPQLKKVKKFIRQIKNEGPSGRTAILADLATYRIDDELPVDLAEQHDHYLYGTPKR